MTHFGLNFVDVFVTGRVIAVLLIHHKQMRRDKIYITSFLLLATASLYHSPFSTLFLSFTISDVSQAYNLRICLFVQN